jgi:phenylpyruvate tautomerase PptA (4-oxalocrotonate tautomerase family)
MAVIYESLEPIRIQELAKKLINILLKKLGKDPEIFKIYEIESSCRVILKTAEFALQLSKKEILPFGYRMIIDYDEKNGWYSPLKDEVYVIGTEGYAKHNNLEEILTNPKDTIFSVRNKKGLEGKSKDIEKLEKIIGEVKAIIIKVLEDSEEKIYLITTEEPLKAPLLHNI